MHPSHPTPTRQTALQKVMWPRVQWVGRHVQICVLLSKPQICGSSHLVSSTALIYRTGSLCSDNEISIRKFPEAVTGPAKLSCEGDTAVIKPGGASQKQCLCLHFDNRFTAEKLRELGWIWSFCVSVFSFPLHFFI